MADDPRVPDQGPGGIARLSSLDLDDLVDELRSRAVSARESQERLRALLDAVVAVTSDLELAAVLRRIVESACHLVDATYGALGVLGPAGEELVEFVTHGISDAERAEIGPLPHGRGLLGMIIRSPHAQRVDRIGDHPESYGFPANHPPMTSFLGAPVRIRDRVYGNLYLTDKRGAAGFSEDDETILTALAAAAGVAIDNARLYRDSLSRQRWGEATRDLVSALLAGRSEVEVLRAATQRILELTGAEGVCISQPDGRTLVVVASAGAAGPAVGSVLDDDRARLVFTDEGVRAETAGDDIVVQLPGSGGHVVGAITVDGIPPELGDPSEHLVDFAQRLGVGLTAASAQQEKARLDLLEDRDRIARDMHDHVIQRLFATGLSLQSASRLTSEPTARDRIETAVDEVDAVIKDIRHTIFALNRAPDSRSLASEITTICEGAVVTLGFAPSLTMRGNVTDVPEQVAADLLAVVREGLSNAARHARASHVEVVVEVTDAVSVHVRDDGVGLPADATRSGLDNLARRASTRGGRFTLASNGTGGTLLEWAVPLVSAD